LQRISILAANCVTGNGNALQGVGVSTKPLHSGAISWQTPYFSNFLALRKSCYQNPLRFKKEALAQVPLKKGLI
jgi:hypothetical protein